MSLQGRYTVIRKIADGGMAEVFLARQHGAQGFEKLVVLKRVRPAYWADPHFRNMLIDEAHIAMGLNHGNVAQVLDLGEAQGHYFLAMELVDGWSAEQLIGRARDVKMPFPQELALAIAGGVCRALAYAHARAEGGKPLGIVHRDVSPHNVLISTQGEIKLADFGIALAQIKREQTGSNVVKGKIAFMSPEQANGEPLDGRSDLFSLGVVLYTMAVGKRPFDGATDLLTLLQVRACQFAPPMRPGLNPQISRIILRAMRKAPAERYQTAEEMLTDIERVMRVAFPATGQTELKQWLADLARKDGAQPPSANAETDGAASGQQTVAADVSSPSRPALASPPPPPAPSESTDTMWRAIAPPRSRRVTLAVAGFAIAVVIGILLVRRPSPIPSSSPASSPVPAPPVPAPTVPTPTVPTPAPQDDPPEPPMAAPEPPLAAPEAPAASPAPVKAKTAKPPVARPPKAESPARRSAKPAPAAPPKADKTGGAGNATKKDKKWYWPF